MNNKQKLYPDISFVDTDTQMLVNALIKSYEIFTGRTLFPADPVRLFILWLADIIIQLRVNIDFSAKQNLPRFSKGKYLDSLSEVFKDTQRLPPEKAKTTLQFTLSAPQETATIIPSGTRVTAGGDIVFETIESLIIGNGKTSSDVTAKCLIPGAIGNGLIPGQINKLIDIFPYFKTVENITTTAGGADEESDMAFYERMRESLETFSTAGPLGSYKYYAKTASSLITDVKADSPTPGVVDVRILLQGGKIPEEETLKAVRDILTADNVRPLTDKVTVSAPNKITYDIKMKYYLQSQSLQPQTPEETESRVNAAVEQYKMWQSEKMGRDINPSFLISLVMQAGVKRVEVESPVFTTVPDNAVAVIDKTEVISRGSENE